MSFLVVRHKVKDYAAWKRSFDQSEEMRREYGLGGGWINRLSHDPNDIVVALRCENLARAKEFMNSERLHEKIREAGVIGELQVMYLEELAEVPEPAVVSKTRVA